jgi:hypothetical protein
MGRARDEETRLRILRNAIGAMRRQAPPGDTGPFWGPASFPMIFTRWWRLLPIEEATEVVRDLVRGVLAEQDGPIHASSNDARFSSVR